MTGVKKKLFVLTSRFPFPLEKGDKLRAYHQIKALSKRYDIILCSTSFKTIDSTLIDELSPYCQEVHVIRLKGWKVSFAFLKTIFNGKPFQVNFFYQKSAQKQIHSIIKNTQVDAIYCQLIRVSEYVKNIHHLYKTIDYMDVLSQGMLRRAKISKGIKRIIFKEEGKRLQSYENRIFDYFDQHFIISKQDKDFIKHPDRERIKVVKNGIDDYFLKYKSTHSKIYDVVFVGNLSYAPNVQAVHYLIEEILPVFESQGQELNVLISGAKPTQQIQQLVKGKKSVTLKGWVEDIRESYTSAKIFVAPLFIGTGQQNKIMEAMALNIPCVTTSLVSKGMGSNENQLLVADSPKQFFDNINQLLNSDELYSQLTHSAYQNLKENYSWHQTIKVLKFL